MNPYTRAALLLIRLVGAGLILFGLLGCGLYLLKSYSEKAAVQVWRCLYLSLPLALGLAVLIKGAAIARRLTQDLEE